MNWTILVIVAVVLAVFFLLKPPATLSAQEARQHLRNGALVVDVRTEVEFHAQHLPGVVNIPLERVTAELPRRVPDKELVVLLHCRSGRRSGIAEKELRNLGYKNAFNLGSYERAEKLLAGGVSP